MKKLGRYFLDERIARGGMAAVYRARLRGADGFEKVMCIKCILPHLARMPAFGAMFRDEAAIAAHLQHHNVVQVFDYGEVDGTLYIAMEYVDGVSLARVLSSGEPLHMAAVMKIGIDVCKGLHHAHTAQRDGKPLGIVHRDVSPQNILLTRQGDVKVADFGVARADVEGRRTHTASGVVKGKVQYMAPEQIVGESFDHRLDQFACGIVLWEALTGQPLFRGVTDYMVLDAITRMQVAPPSSVRPEIPPSVDAVVLRALEKNPRDRFADMQELGDALMQCMSGMPVFPGDVPGPAALDLVPLIARVIAKGPVRSLDDDDGSDANLSAAEADVTADEYAETRAESARESAQETIATPFARADLASGDPDEVDTFDESAQLRRPTVASPAPAPAAGVAAVNDVVPETRIDRAAALAARNKQASIGGSQALFVRALVIILVVAGAIAAAWIALSSTQADRAVAALQCPPAYAAVKGEGDVAPFCVAMFEMKRADDAPGGIAPRADGPPILDVTRDDAIARCRAIGAGYHLIDNDEWQALAHDIENVDGNWTGGAVGAGVLVVGNSGVSAGPVLENDPCATPGTPTRFPRCLDRTSSDFIRQRTHRLSSGAVVWDVGSNASEWTASDTSARAPTDVRSTACSAEGEARRAYGPSRGYKCGTAPNPLMFGCLEGSNSKVIIRGGSSSFEGTPWDSCPGVFYTNTNDYWDATTKVGQAFRCAWRPVTTKAKASQ